MVRHAAIDCRRRAKVCPQKKEKARPDRRRAIGIRNRPNL